MKKENFLSPSSLIIFRSVSVSAIFINRGKSKTNLGAGIECMMGKISIPFWPLFDSLWKAYFQLISFGKWSNYNLWTWSECKQGNYGNSSVIGMRNFGTKLLQINLTSVRIGMSNELMKKTKTTWTRFWCQMHRVCVWRSLKELKLLDIQLNYNSEQKPFIVTRL